MGKQTNAQILRFFKTRDWISKYYCSFFNYSNFISDDRLIRNYILNLLGIFNIKLVQIYIYREEFRIVIRLFSYNDSFTNWKSFLFKQRKKIRYRNRLIQRLSKKHQNILGFENCKSHDWFKKDNKLSQEIFFFKNKNELDYISFNRGQHFIGYSVKRLLSLNLSYLLKTNVVIKNTNIITKQERVLLLTIFSSMAIRLRSPLSKYLRIKFICLVYYSLLYKSSLLLCVYLSSIIPRFCKKKRQSRKINPFLKSLKSVVKLMFSSPFKSQLNVKGVKITIRGRINGSRRKRVYSITKGCSSTQSFGNQVNYYVADAFTIFGILGIKVWIIY